MQADKEGPVSERLRKALIGPPIDLNSKAFHKLSLIAFFAWVGLGADGLSSSSYGPEEAFLTLQSHPYLGVFVAILTAVTVFVIGASYSQIIELFPHGGGGYVVASKLLSPRLGMISGCALLIDYALTITVSVASGADALFSFLPREWFVYRVGFAVAGVLLLIILNLRGVKESVTPLVPVFTVFFLTHVFLISYAVYSHMGGIPELAGSVSSDMGAATAELGLWGMVLLILRAYSMGAGTYTGLEAVSNGIPLLREPRVQTAKRTMTYMVLSLAFAACGLMLAYLLYSVGPRPGMTLNAVLLAEATSGWGASGYYFFVLTLASEAALLFVASQTGFLGGPRVLANMALDWWVPKRFALLSDRFVNHYGILIMGGAALVLMIATGGSVKFLIVLYSINVFITFFLSQLGIIRHFALNRETVRDWGHKMAVGGLGLVLTGFILVSVVYVKFYEGGWITLLITGMFIAVAVTIRRHYDWAESMMRRLDAAVMSSGKEASADFVGPAEGAPTGEFDRTAKTAVILVDGFNGLGLHILSSVLRLGGCFSNFVFVQVGRLDAGNFKGISEVGHLGEHTKADLGKYVDLMRRLGYHAEGMYSVGTDVAEEVTAKLAPKVRAKYPDATFFGGNIVLPDNSFLSRALHNYTILSIQRKLARAGAQFVMLPVKI
jgi:amino acid transporter